MGRVLTTLLVDSHVVYWMGASPERLSKVARRTIDDADEVAVAAITWYELSWLGEHDRLRLDVSPRTWIEATAPYFRTIALTPSIAATAGALPDALGGDPADRLIYATAVETGMDLITKDERLRAYRGPRKVCIW